MMDINIALGILQVIVLLFQCWVAFNEYNKGKKEKKGIFQISYNNISNYYESTSLNWKYDLNKMVSFKNIGDDFVNVVQTDIIVNGRQKNNNAMPVSIAVTNRNDFSTYLIGFNMSERELKEESLDVTLKLHLVNSNNYSYKQIIQMGFKKEGNVWILNKYNWNITK